MSAEFETISKNINYDNFYNIIYTIPSNIFFKDTELKYRFCTHHWSQVNDEDIIGKTDLEIRRDKENAYMAMETDRNIIRSGVGCKYVIKSELEGIVSYLELIKEPVFSDDGKVIGIVGLINDVTEKNLLEQEVKMSNEELKLTLQKVQKMNTSQGLFMASMNHELRSPLNAIIGLLRMVLDDSEIKDNNRNYIYEAYKSSLVMLELVNELLDYAKMETDEFKIRKDRFDLKSLIINVQNASNVLAIEKGLDFSVSIGEGIRDIQYYGDDLRITQIINNLVTNAIKYTDSGKVLLDAEWEEDMLTIRCVDTGQGISEEAQKVLFDPYVRINEDKNKLIQGTGLGLSIVKKIVDGMGGSITVDSTIGKGSTFAVKIPLEEWNENCTVEKRKTVGEKIENTDFSNMRILCVDDTHVNVTVFAGLLKSTGITVDRAYSGMECLELVETNKYDIIFMDHSMPDMDGVETFKRLRENSVINKDTPVVILTANVGKEYEKEYEDIGFDGYLSKPIMKEKLISIISSFM